MDVYVYALWAAKIIILVGRKIPGRQDSLPSMDSDNLFLHFPFFQKMNAYFWKIQIFHSL